MSSPRYSTVEMKVGIFLAFCLALFVVMLIIFGRFSPMWRNRAEIRVAFENVASLRTDAPVRYNGMEVGRVKSMRLLHLSENNIPQLLPLAKRDLDNLPLPEATKKKLREVNEADFRDQCFAALINRTMIELRLEVLQEGDTSRYRMDDHIRIVSTVLGDSAVEIISGNGANNDCSPDHLLLGTSGDFFSNLAKSMGDVKEILSSVTDVVGTQERRSFERAQARLSGINARLDSMSALTGKRAEATSKRIDKLGGEIGDKLNEASKALEKIQPDAETAAKDIRDGFKAMQDRMGGLQTDAAAAMKDVSDDTLKLRNDVKKTLDASQPDVAEIRKRMPGIYRDFGNLSGRIQDGRDMAGRLMSQSDPDLARAKTGVANGLLYLKQTGEAANENKDLMLSGRDKGEHEYATAQCVQHDLEDASRHVREARADAQEAAGLLEPAPVPTPTRSFAEATMQKLAGLQTVIDAVRNVVEAKMLPPYERKKTAWEDAPVSGAR